MKRLVYGIVRAGPMPPGPIPSGPEGCPVGLLTEGGLAAAFSVVPDACAAPAVAHALAFARVVQALHQADTVLPMRYGCLLGSDEQVRELLRVRQTEYLAALGELAGCVEMGLRVLLTETDEPVVVSPELMGSPGAAYLAARRARYAAKDTGRQAAAGAAERFHRTFDRLYLQCDVESSCAEMGTLLSLHFLVRREHIEPFQATFRQLQADSREKLLLTGPWPPYHFATSGKTDPLSGSILSPEFSSPC